MPAGVPVRMRSPGSRCVLHYVGAVHVGSNALRLRGRAAAPRGMAALRFGIAVEIEAIVEVA